MDYIDYIQSDRWKQISSSIKKVCIVCGSKEKIQIHHKSYKRLGRGTKKDLAALCKKCHMEAHDILSHYPKHLQATQRWNSVVLLKKRKKSLESRFPEPAINSPSAPKIILRKKVGLSL